MIFHQRKFRFAIPFIALAFIALVGLVVMSLWNTLLPEILHVSAITFWQAIGIFILCKILFGFGRGGRMGPPWMRRGMHERFKDMSPEEREKFKEQMEYRCGWKRRDTGVASAETNVDVVNPS
jgi:hypothetical protein